MRNTRLEKLVRVRFHCAITILSGGGGAILARSSYLAFVHVYDLPYNLESVPTVAFSLHFQSRTMWSGTWIKLHHGRRFLIASLQT